MGKVIVRKLQGMLRKRYGSLTVPSKTSQQPVDPGHGALQWRGTCPDGLNPLGRA
jgi:hypothetical protein